MNVYTASNELKNPPGISWSLIALEAALILAIVLVAIYFS